MNPELSVTRETIAAQIELKRAGRRKLVRHGGALCCRCLHAPPLPYHGYCRQCRNTRDREKWRKAQDAKKGAIAQPENHTDGQEIA